MRSASPVAVVGPLLALVLVAVAAGGAAAAPFQTRLTADPADVDISFGLVLPQANTVAPDGSMKPPPGAYNQGTMVVAMFPSLSNAGTYEIFTVNSTGNIPIRRRLADGNFTGQASDEPTSPAPHKVRGEGMCLYKWTTSDFRSYSGGNACLLWFGKSGLSDIKTLARDDDKGEYYLLYWSLHGIGQQFTSTTAGEKWVGPRTVTFSDPPQSTNLHPKDDINYVWQKDFGLVNMQIFWQRNLPTTPGGYCDNGGCNSRRIVGSMKTSSSHTGEQWTYSGSARFPSGDEQDPPELQFYRIRPFVMPGTQGARVFAHTLLYAPSPWINKNYGRQPSMCQSGADAHNCHGPHMYEEWWTLKRGASPADVSKQSWRRPARFTKMAPENAYLFAQPGLTGTGAAMKMVWVGSGSVYTLPLHRGVGIYAPANARVKVQPAFTMRAATSSTTLYLNADVKWGAKLPAGGCDETCAAYVLAELQDHNGKTIQGYDQNSFDAIMDKDGINLPLTWNGSARLPTNQKSIVVKLWFRAAKIYAVYMGNSFSPGA